MTAFAVVARQMRVAAVVCPRRQRDAVRDKLRIVPVFAAERRRKTAPVCVTEQLRMTAADVVYPKQQRDVVRDKLRIVPVFAAERQQTKR